MIVKPTRLYLQKDEKKLEIFVDFHHELHHHQVDGVRVLYKLYKKKKPGVILNDPSGYGKCIQTALFINALRPLLNNRPVLILCNEGDVDNWRLHFSKWTDFSDEISIESTNPFSKKLFHINTVKDALTFCRRHWSIIVVHDNCFTKDILHAAFKADFKIWITSIYLKENLQKFSLLHQWLYPKEKFRIEEFSAKKNDPKDILYKSLILDAFLEDIIIRRDDFTTPYKAREIQSPRILESPLKRTKNKDLTGTKVKRSKKQLISNDPDENTTSVYDNDIEVSNNFSTISTRTKTKSSKKRIVYDDDDEPNESTTIKYDTSISDDSCERTKDYSTISTSTKTKRSKKLIINDDDDEPNESTAMNASVPVNRGNTSKHFSMISTGTKSMISKNKDGDPTNGNVSNKYAVDNNYSTNSETLFNFTTVHDKPKSEAMDVETFIRDENPIKSDGFKYYTAEGEYKTNDSNTFTDFRTAIDNIIENENNENHEQETVSHKDTESNVSTVYLDNAENTNSFSIFKQLNAVIKQSDTEDDSLSQYEAIYKQKDITIKQENGNNTDNMKISSEHGIDISKENEAETSKNSNIKSIKNEVCTKTSGHKDIYEQLAELEEQALKKFKGSFLDRMF